MSRTSGDNLSVQIKSEQYSPAPADQEKIDATVDAIRPLVRDFSVADLHLHIIHHPRSNDFHVKADLRLPGRDLFTGERHEYVFPALDECIRQLVRKVKEYKKRLRANSPGH